LLLLTFRTTAGSNFHPYFPAREIRTPSPQSRWEQLIGYFLGKLGFDSWSRKDLYLDFHFRVQRISSVLFHLGVQILV
jgi:hypothetical protein